MVLKRGAVVALIAALTIPVAAEPAESARRPIRIDGRGFGHGRGLGQWGAKAMADAGKSWRQIVGHYYAGASLTKRRPGERIRVLVATSSDVVVTSARRFRMQWADGVSIGLNDTRRRFVRVRREREHWVVDFGRSPWGPWRRATRSWRHVVFVRGLSPLEVVARDGSSRSYRGTIMVTHNGAVNYLPLDEYLFGVVPREVPSSWPPAALRAQSVAARTYAAWMMERHHRRAYDICATTACQVYGGLATRSRPAGRTVVLERSSTNAAALSTLAMTLTRRGRPILAEYSSSTGGHTQGGRDPALRAVPDPWDRVSPHHSWVTHVDASAVERAWSEIGRLRRITIRSRDGLGEWGGRVRTVRIAGSRRTIDVSGGSFAARLHLRSRWFRVDAVSQMYRFTTNLREGAAGRAVRELQWRLKQNGFFTGRIVSHFGPATREALRRYQRSRRIQLTGTLGPQTRARLNAEARP